MTVARIIEAARFAASETLQLAEAVVMRDIERITTGAHTDASIAPAWKRLTQAERQRTVRLLVLQAFRSGKSSEDAIPQAVRDLVRFVADRV